MPTKGSTVLGKLKTLGEEETQIIKYEETAFSMAMDFFKTDKIARSLIDYAKENKKSTVGAMTLNQIEDVADAIINTYNKSELRNKLMKELVKGN